MPPPTIKSASSPFPVIYPVVKLVLVCFLLEESFPGVRLESSVYFFVSQCAALTDDQLGAVRADFLQHLESLGLCTTSDLLQCHLEDTSVHCRENDDHQGIAKRDTESQVPVVNYTLAIEGMSRSQSYCDLTCATHAECERCLWLYKSNATRLLEQEAHRVRRLLVQEERTATTTTMARAPYAAMLVEKSRGSFRYDAPAAASPGRLNLGGVTLRLQSVSVSSANLYCDLGTTNIDGRCGKHVITTQFFLSHQSVKWATH